MNKYNIKDFLGDTLKGCESTFKCTSKDTEHNTYLCQDTSTKNVYNFDQYVKENHNNELPPSPDAIYLGDKKFCFIEFKNSKPQDIKPDNIKCKFTKGTKILQELLKDYKPRDIKFVFCVVYKKIDSALMYGRIRKIRERPIRFGLDEINAALGGFYDDIITKDIEYYKKNFQKLQC